MRIAHVTATFPPYYAGTGNVCYHNARELAARGHDVHVFTAAWSGTPDDPPGVAVHRLRPIVRVGNAPLLPQLGALRHFDLVHLHYPFISGAEFLTLGATLRRTPLILTYHNDLLAPGLRGRFFSIYERSLGHGVLSLARRIVAVSLAHANASPAVSRATHRSRQRIVELPNGVDVNAFHPMVDGQSIRQRFQIPEAGFVVAFVGRLDAAHHFKRVDLLLDAVAASFVPDIHVLIIGDGELRAEYEQRAADRGLSSRTHFTGTIPHAQLPPYLAAADTLVLPSDSVESFGLVLIEAMACGRPVIASDLAGVSTVVSHGHDGLLVPPGDEAALASAIRQLAKLAPLERMTMGAVGRYKVETRYTWERVGEQLDQLYHEVIHEQPVRTATSVR